MRSEFWPDGQLKTRFDAANAATGYTYDSAGRLATSTDPLSRVTTYGYDLEGRRLWTQDHGGNCTATPKLQCTSVSYNTSDEVTGIAYSDDNGMNTPDVTNVIYDGNGRRTSSTDGSGASIWVWNPFGELTSTTAGSGDVIGYTYDRRGLANDGDLPGKQDHHPNLRRRRPLGRAQRLARRGLELRLRRGLEPDHVHASLHDRECRHLHL